MSAKKKDKSQLIKNLIFVILGAPLCYLFIIDGIQTALFALLGLSILYLVLRPFSVSVRAAMFLLAGYLAVSGLLSFSQPIFEQSWIIFVIVLVISSLLQPVIFVMLIDTILDILGKRHRFYDTVLIVLLWVATFVVTFGTLRLVQGDTSDKPAIFILLIIPWLVNGAVFVASAIVLTFAKDKKKLKKSAKKAKTKKTK